MRALVIGADGFAGRWLVRHLRNTGDTITALVGPSYRPAPDDDREPLQVDIRDAETLERAIVAAAPDVVYDLAGISRQGDREDLILAVGVSVVGSLNALAACARLSPAPRLLFVSTGYVYLAGPGPLTEDSALQPDSTYAAAKLAAERALLTLGPVVGVDVVVARPFNHIGPGQSEAFLVPTLARQVAAALSGHDAAVIHVADASVVRDFTDVRDVVAGYRLIAERGRPGVVYNIASGTGVSVAELASAIGSIAGIGVRVQDAVTQTQGGARVLIGHAGRLESLGWRRAFALRTTLEDVIHPHVAKARTAG